jgi:uncharacterized protein with HEPN domain
MPSRDPQRRVRDILKAANRIKAYIADIGGLDALMRDEFLHRDGDERQLLIIAEAAVKLRGQVEDIQPGIDWDAIRGMGNVIRHSYDNIDDMVIRRVLTAELAQLSEACIRLLETLG